MLAPITTACPYCDCLQEFDVIEPDDTYECVDCGRDVYYLPPVDCYEKGKANGEPVFTLRAKDKLAPGIIEIWADLAAKHGADPEKVAEARQIAAEMREWPDTQFPT